MLISGVSLAEGLVAPNDLQCIAYVLVLPSPARLHAMQAEWTGHAVSRTSQLYRFGPLSIAFGGIDASKRVAATGILGMNDERGNRTCQSGQRPSN
jgi:hypothetical protein